jgi:ketosteroid isomerase-like protein
MESCFAAIAAQDADRLVTHYTEDYVLELPYYKPDESLVVEGREAVHGYLAGLLAVQRMTLTLGDVRSIPEESLLIAEYTSRGDFLDTGELYYNSYVGYWFFEGEHLRHLREYYNPQAPRAPPAA